MNLKQIIKFYYMMKSKALWSHCIFILFILWGSLASAQVGIQVWAGADTAICRNTNFNISSLNAYIRGEVTDGTWFTTGDGKFSPSFASNGQFSSTLTYMPGAADVALGYTDLILVSFDPDGLGPKVQVSDNVRLNFIIDPPMVCSNNLNVSLGTNCSQQITPSMLLANIQGSPSNYSVTLFLNGVQLPSNVITREYLNKQLEFRVRFICGTNNCWGYITAQDKEAPTLVCRDTIVDCSESILPTVIGFPIAKGLSYTQTSTNRFEFPNGDNCGSVTLIYTDEVIKLQCSQGGLNSRIIRRWEALDALGNKSSCSQTIFIKAKPLSTVTLPSNFDDIDKQAFICGSNFNALPNGHPSTIAAGSPSGAGCTNLEFTFTDSRINVCGNSFKIVRKWTMIDWCNSSTREHTQLIKVLDKTPPKVTCPAPTVWKTTAYDCHSGTRVLPVPTIVDECGTANTYFVNVYDSLSRLRNNFILASATMPTLKDLPVGRYRIQYIASDACGNLDSCNLDLRVIDDQPPFVLCSSFTTLSLTTSPTTSLFPSSIDQGSTDNCGILKYEIARMTDSCGSQANVFKPFVEFCCKDVGRKVMVSLRVTDFYGNANTCMVEVTVEDKSPPKITCPSNITIACTYPVNFQKLDEFGIVRQLKSNVSNVIIKDGNGNDNKGKDGFVEDNCGTVITSSFVSNIKCHKGTIVRKFVAVDGSGNRDSCFQTITIIDPNPFKRSDIIWPSDTTVSQCFANNIDTIKFGSPVLTNTSCTVLMVNHKDLVFELNEAVCYKILRTWTVIDWCRYQDGDTTAVWTKDQLIQLSNTVAPTFTTTFRDTSLCLYSANCGAETFNFDFKAKDDCTPDSLLRWNYSIDINSNGIVDQMGTSSKVSASIIPGRHKVVVEVKDRCGNKSTYTFFITGKDCKAPSPYCVESLGTVIMPTTSSITVWARDFNKGSTDNCTLASKLKYSFSKDILDTSKTVTCADIPNGISDTLLLKMWVTDEDGNQDFCNIRLVVQDNSDACPDAQRMVQLSGKLEHNLGTLLDGVNLNVYNMNSGSVIKQGNTLTNAFNVKDILSGNKYGLRFEKEDDILTGVNVFDLLDIQRHILALKKFTDPYQILAADVDNSGKVAVGDLVELKRVVIGSISKFSSNLPFWHFVRKDNIFIDPNQPQREVNILETDVLKAQNLNTLDIMAYKLGNVTSKGEEAASSQTLSNRSEINFLGLKVEQKSNLMEFSFDKSITLNAFQLSIVGFKDIKGVVFHPKLANNASIHLNEVGVLSIIYFSVQDEYLKEGEPLFTIVEWKGGIPNLSVDLKAFAVENNEIASIKLENTRVSSSKGTLSYDVWTSKDRLIVSSPHDWKHDVEVLITDFGGNIMVNKQISLNPGINNLDISNLVNGLYICRIQNRGQIMTKRFSLFR
jgi:hypothetical protein